MLASTIKYTSEEEYKKGLKILQEYEVWNPHSCEYFPDT